MFLLVDKLKSPVNAGDFVYFYGTNFVFEISFAFVRIG